MISGYYLLFHLLFCEVHLHWLPALGLVKFFRLLGCDSTAMSLWASVVLHRCLFEVFYTQNRIID
jgi:hypothetical protein